MVERRVAPRLAVIVAGLVCGIALAGPVTAQDGGNAATLNAEVSRLYQAGKYGEAIEVAKQLLGMREKALGPDHTRVAEVLGSLALLYERQGRNAEAEQLYKRSLTIAEKAHGPDHLGVGALLNNLATVYRQQGRYAEAELLLQRSVAIAEKALGPDHPDVGTALNNFAFLYSSQGRYAEAEQLYKRSLAIAEKAHGPNHQDVGIALNNLATLYMYQSRYAEAEILIKRDLAMTEKVLGPDHPEVGTALNNLAWVYRAQGHYAAAEPIYIRSVAILVNGLGAEHPEVAQPLMNLALLYQSQGRYAEAEQLLMRCLGIREKAWGPEHRDVGMTVSNLALVYNSQGRYEEAEPLLKRSLAIMEKTLGFDHPEVGLLLNNLAELYRAMGRHAEAEPLYKRNLAIWLALDPQHRSVGTSLNNLALLYQDQGRFDEAAPLYERSLVIAEKALGPEHPEVGQILNNLGLLVQYQRRYTEAEPLFQRSLTIRKKALGPEHRDVGQSLNNLATLYLNQGRYTEADPLLKRSLEIHEKQLGYEHHDTAQVLSNLGDLAFRQGQWVEAATYLRRSTSVIQRRFAHGHAGGRREDFWTLVQAADRVRAQGSASAPLTKEMFEIAQWAQGSEAATSLAHMAARSAKGSPSLAALVREQQDLLNEWQVKDRQFIAAKSDMPAKRNDGVEKKLADRLTAIDARLAEIERRLAQDFTEYAALANPGSASAAEVQDQLRTDEALVLFLDTPEWSATPEESFVWVVTKSDVRWVRSDLGTAALTREVAALRCGLDATAWDEAGADVCAKILGLALDKVPGPGKSLPFDHASAHKLYAALFGKVQDLISGKHLLIVPSGPLTQLPFQVLVTKPPTSTDHGSVAWLTRQHAISVLPAVSSLRALRRVAKPSAASRPMIGFGNPLLDGPDTRFAGRAKLAREKQRCQHQRPQRTAFVGLRGGVQQVETRRGLADVSHIKMQVPLPETADELCAVAQDVRADAHDIHLGAQATEHEIKRLSAIGDLAKYRIVHFATHGALAGQLDGAREPGLVLTPPEKASEDDDGYLSASEIASLKLDADWVILSACNTAAGAATNAEALSGLARAFIYAQARALLVSHWEVYSDATVKLITVALREMARDPKVGRAEAMRRSMLALIDKGQPHEAHPAYWAPFVVVGEGAAARRP
jgi:tetratricopeptide (TPR) repeat protein/CHAT domain-containing protein